METVVEVTLDSPTREERGQKVFILLVLFLTLLGFYFRLVYANNISLHEDEFVSLLAVRGILQEGFPRLPSGLFYDQGLLFSYLEALNLYLFGFSIMVARTFSLLLSVLTIPLLYFIGKRLFSRNVGLIAAALLSLSSEAIMWGGRARMYSLLQIWALLCVYFLYRTIKDDDARSRHLFLFCYLCAILTHSLTVLIFFPLLLGAFVVRRASWFLKRGVLLEFSLAGVATLVPFFLKKLGQPGQLEAIGQVRPFLEPSLNLIKNAKPFSPFFLSLEHLPITLLGLLGLIFLLLFALGRGRRKSVEEGSLRDLKALGFLYTIFGTTFLEMILLVGRTWRNPRYLFILLPIFYLIASQVLITLVVYISQRLRISSRFQGRVVLTSTYSLTILLMLFSFPSAYRMTRTQVWGYDLAFYYVRSHWQEGDVVLTIAPYACDLYLERCDYYATQLDYEEYVFERGGILIDRYTGARLLNSPSQLEEVLKDNPRVWFVVDGWRLATHYDVDFLRYLAEGMETVYQVRGVRVLFCQECQVTSQPRAVEPLQINFGDEILLSGYDLDTAVLKPGDELRVTLYWQPLDRLKKDYVIFVHLLDKGSKVIAQDDVKPMGGLYPTIYWQEGEVIPDQHLLRLSPDLPPGRHLIEVGIYSSETEERLAVIDQEGKIRDDKVVLGYVKVVTGTEKPSSPTFSIGAILAGWVRLVGYDTDATGSMAGDGEVILSAAPGEVMSFTLYWQALAYMERDYTVFLHLIDESGKIWGQTDSQPCGGFYPTSIWDEGEVVLDEHLLTIPPQTPEGEYTVIGGMYLLATGERLPLLDEAGQPTGDTFFLSKVEVER
ncbi:MAG: glycosyltransferase family 39 protein [Anaerolineae bacterium]|nr:glycosyltransferase family 39 protein [Anaerolineae bacterium]